MRVIPEARGILTLEHLSKMRYFILYTIINLNLLNTPSLVVYTQIMAGTPSPLQDVKDSWRRKGGGGKCVINFIGWNCQPGWDHWLTRYEVVVTCAISTVEGIMNSHTCRENKQRLVEGNREYSTVVIRIPWREIVCIWNTWTLLEWYLSPKLFSTLEGRDWHSQASLLLWVFLSWQKLSRLPLIQGIIH